MTNLAIACRCAARRLVLVSATALSLAACSSSADRFADFSDVNTSSLPDEQAAETGSDSSVAATQLPDRPAWQNASSSDSEGRGGSVVVQPGQTLYSIAMANGLTPDELAAANRLPPPYTIRVGQNLRVPNRADPVSPDPSFGPQSIEAANAPADESGFRQPGTHVVRSGETLFSIGRSYDVDPFAIAEHNRLREPYTLAAGQRLSIPAPEPGSARRAEKPQTLDEQLARRQAAVEEQPPVASDYEPEADEAPRAQMPAALEPPAAETASSFRWPVKGRIISAFGQKPNGMRNEGINIAVPEGTSVRAAESGVVAYAGNELKGYGNLILIRHDGGWVTAYAHNQELLVSRGDTVKRGDVIAKAGQTGSVSTPQVHFEVRKGATAVDPMQHLESLQAMN